MRTKREFLFALGAGLAAPAMAWAQQVARPTPKVFRIGVLEPTSEGDNRANFEAFREGLRDLGYIDGRNVVIDYRSADGRAERFPEFVTELVQKGTDILVARGTPAVLAARAAGKVPVVMSAVADPIGQGLVASMEKPGGNVTGLATLARDLTSQRLALLRELVPKARRVGQLVNMSNPANAAQWKETEALARTLGMEAVLLDVREPQDFNRAFETAVSEKVDGLLVNVDALIIEHRRAVPEFAAKHKLPAVYSDRDFVEVGGLLSYGVHYPHLYYRAAGYVSRILRGARPDQLPVEKPTKFYLVINRRTARSLGMTLPPALLKRADRVIG